mgnify:CR=1 FL=1
MPRKTSCSSTTARGYCVFAADNGQTRSSLGRDVITLAEPGALIGFAGPRVIEQTVRETLPEGFQRAEFLLEKGAVDLIVDRRQMRTRLGSLLTLMTRQPALSV